MAWLNRRGKYYTIRYSIGGNVRETATGSTNLQVAKEKMRQLESALAQGQDNPLPGKTPIAQIVGEYVRHIRLIKTPKSAQTDAC